MYLFREHRHELRQTLFRVLQTNQCRAVSRSKFFLNMNLNCGLGCSGKATNLLHSASLLACLRKLPTPRQPQKKKVRPRLEPTNLNGRVQVWVIGTLMQAMSCNARYVELNASYLAQGPSTWGNALRREKRKRSGWTGSCAVSSSLRPSHSPHSSKSSFIPHGFYVARVNYRQKRKT